MRTKIADGSIKIAIIGLGYVGLPLAVAFGKKFDTVGFDVKESRIAELRSGRDNTLETLRRSCARPSASVIPPTRKRFGTATSSSSPCRLLWTVSTRRT